MSYRGCTYALRSEPYDGWAKIGRTDGTIQYGPQSRLRSCQTGNPRKLVIHAIWPIDRERELHDAFAEFRGNGEWFALPLPLLDCMAACGEARRPFVEFRMEWRPERVWALAGGKSDELGPEELARIFMARSAALGPKDREPAPVVDLWGSKRTQTAHRRAS